MGRGLEMQPLEDLSILSNVKAAHNSESNFRLVPYHVSSKGPSGKNVGNVILASCLPSLRKAR